MQTVKIHTSKSPKRFHTQKWGLGDSEIQTAAKKTSKKNFLGEWKFQEGWLHSDPCRSISGPVAHHDRSGRNLCQKVCFLTEPHLHIWIIHSDYKHIKWHVATCHLKAEIRPSQLIMKMSNVSGWTHAPGSPPLVWWLYAQTIDKVSSYRLLRCWGLKRGFPSPLLPCRMCQGRKTRPRSLNGFSNGDYT